jgi:HSP20 family protein
LALGRPFGPREDRQEDTMARLPVRIGERTVAVIDPPQEFADIYDRMGALVNAALGYAGPAWLAEMPWSPLADVSETDDAYIIRIDLPGVRKDQIDVRLQDRELAVTGEADGQPAARRHRSTRRTGRSRTGRSCPACSRRSSSGSWPGRSSAAGQPGGAGHGPAVRPRHRRSGRVDLALLAVASIAASWLGVHAIFTGRCALLYLPRARVGRRLQPARAAEQPGLRGPGADHRMTFQVSGTPLERPDIHGRAAARAAVLPRLRRPGGRGQPGRLGGG